MDPLPLLRDGVELGTSPCLAALPYPRLNRGSRPHWPHRQSRIRLWELAPPIPLSHKPPAHTEGLGNFRYPVELHAAPWFWPAQEQSQSEPVASVQRLPQVISGTRRARIRLT